MRGRTLCAALLTVIAALVATGCRAAVPASASGQPSLENSGWVLQSYGSPGSLAAVMPQHIPTLYFDDATLRGFAGCNTLTGSYSAAASGQFSIEDLSYTEMYCTDEGVMNQEEAYLGTLRRAQGYSVDDTTLTITGDGTVLVFVNDCFCSD